MMKITPNHLEGILLVDKEVGSTSFRIVSELRKLTKIKKIGHAGTLDPFASGVMVMLIGPTYTKKSNDFLCHDKQYEALVHLGIATDSYDVDGTPIHTSSLIPTFSDVAQAISLFQGEILQIPPMFSAKKIQGKKLYDLARQGIEVKREPCKVKVSIQLIEYAYPFIKLIVDCSKGTYIRSLAHDLGQHLKTGAHLKELKRTKSGSFSLQDCIKQENLRDLMYNINPHMIQL